MGAIYLIRHAQASFGAANYDALSERGHTQARILGEHLYRHEKPDHLFSGAMLRHRDTAKGYMGVSQSSDLRIDPGFNEYNHEDILRVYDDRFRKRESIQDFLRAQENPRKAFERVFKASVKQWLSGEHDAIYQESWPQFSRRVVAAMEALLASLRPSQCVFIFTSGGPISVICQWVLGLGLKETFAINENLVNGGLTRLLYSRTRLSISYLNNYSHFETLDASMVTYR